MAPLSNFCLGVFYIAWFLALRGMLANPQLPEAIPELMNFFWISSVAKPDPYFILPTISCVLMYMSIARNLRESEKTANMPAEMRQMMSLFKWIPFVTLPVMAFLPAGLHCYFVALNLFNYGLGIFFNAKFFNDIAKSSLEKRRKEVEGEIHEIINSPIFKVPMDTHIESPADFLFSRGSFNAGPLKPEGFVAPKTEETSSPTSPQANSGQEGTSNKTT